MKPDKKYILITGATSGIGFELAKLFAKDNYNLVIVARDEQKLTESATELKNLGVDVIALSKDLFLRESPFEIYEEIKTRGIIIEMLINDAGQGAYGEFVDIDLNRELDIIQLNISAVVVLTKLFLKDMVSRNAGRILNVASIAGKVPGPYQAVYHGTKAFIHSFTEAIRSEVKASGSAVTITSLLPGATDTDFFNKADMEQSKVVQEGKLGDPETVARDGYEALLEGKDMVVSGFKNKVQVAMANMLPDSVSAENMRKTQEPINKDKED